MNIPNIIHRNTKGFWLKQNANDSDMLDICTLNTTGKYVCWGSIMNDAVVEAGFDRADIMAWEAIPEDKKRLTTIRVSLNLEEIEVQE